MKNKLKSLTTKAWYRPALDIAVLTAASVCFAAGAQLFILPNLLNVGGFLGIAQLITILPKADFMSSGIYFILLNVPLLIISHFVFSRKFVLKTAYEVILSGGLIELFYRIDLAELIGLVNQENLTLIAICGGILVAVSAAATLYVNSANGGMDIVALMLQKKYNFSHVSRWIMLFDVVVSVIFAFCIKRPVTVFYSIATIAAHQVALELMLGGMSNAVMFEIITDSPESKESLIDALSRELNRGTTVIKAVGSYTSHEKEIVVCVVRKRQEAEARMLINKIAPDSFAYSIAVKEVIGEGFKNINL